MSYELNFEFHDEPRNSPFYDKIITETWDHIPQIGSILDFTDEKNEDLIKDYDFFKVDGISYLYRYNRLMVTIFMVSL